MNARLLTVWRFLAVALVTLAAYRVAWVSDDALITLRTALNLSHGWGAGFNATEAVQAYTHPLWFLAWLGIGAATNQWIIGIVALSLLLTAAAVALVAWRTDSVPRLILMVGALALSNAFVEYATSGLENSLGFLLLGVLLVLTWREVGPLGGSHVNRGLAIGLVTAGAFLTRMDFAVLVAIPLMVVLWSWRRAPVRIAWAAAGLLVPVAAWFLWTNVTYAAWLPNTFLAKRNVEIPATELIAQGWQYLSVTVRHDPITAIAILAGVALALAAGNAIARAWSAGVIAYLGYVVWIGGDFMVGRFLAVPVYLAVSVTVLTPVPVSMRGIAVRMGTVGRSVAAVGAVVVVALLSALAGRAPVAITNPQSERWQYVDEHGVADERGFYLAEAKRSLDNITSNSGQPFTLEGFIPPVGAEFAKSGLRDIDRLAGMWPTSQTPLAVPADAAIVCGLTGSWGIVSGPTVHLIDVCGLTDRFLAAEPFVPSGQWRVGHFERPMPEGYEAAIRASDPTLMTDPQQAQRLADLWALIRAK